MKWSETLSFNQPLREVCLLADVPSQSWVELLSAREEAGYQRGRRDGENALSQQLVQQRAEIAELQRGILESLSQAVPQVVKETESGLITLALEASRRIVADMPISPELVESVVREAVKQVEDSAEIIIQLHSEDLALLRKHDSKLFDGLPDVGSLRFVTSSEVARGGCMVQTRFGLIDARREVKFEQLTEAVKS